MLMSTDDAFDEYLVKDAQAAATQWGADRFAEEFARRDEEERRLRDAEAGIFFRYPGVTYPDEEPEPAMMTGPVDESVSDRVIEAAAVGTVEIRKPKPIRHAHVPRPPAQEQSSGPRRSWRRRGQDRATRWSWAPSEAELARMSAAGRRLYGVDSGNDARPAS